MNAIEVKLEMLPVSICRNVLLNVASDLCQFFFYFFISVFLEYMRKLVFDSGYKLILVQQMHRGCSQFVIHVLKFRFQLFILKPRYFFMRLLRKLFQRGIFLI